jgi:hypothetical protein
MKNTTPLNRYGLVIRGTGRSMHVVWLIEQDETKVKYQAPNPWAFRAGDPRAGWSKPQTAPLSDLVSTANPAPVAIEVIEKTIGKPPAAMAGGKADGE